MCNPGGMPEDVDYRRYAVQQRVVDGAVPLASMARLRAAVHDLREADADARVRLEFSEDGQRRVRLNGEVSTRVVLQCQRCMQPFIHEMNAPIAGVVVADDAGAASVPRADEPIMANGESLDLPALVEDELLLALPMVARCSRPDCQTRYNTDSNNAPAATESTRERQDNPFSVLDQIKPKHDTD